MTRNLKRGLWRAKIGSRTIGWYDHPMLAVLAYDVEAKKRNKPTNFL